MDWFLHDNCLRHERVKRNKVKSLHECHIREGQGGIELFHDGGSNDTETSLLICSANQWTGFYMIGASIMRESRHCQASIMK